MKALFDWKSINWELSDQEISRLTGVKADTVYHARQRLGKASVNSWKKFWLDQPDSLWTLSNKAAARKLNMSVNAVAKWRKRLEKPPRALDKQRPKPKPPTRKPDPIWQRVNWDLPNHIIAKAIGKNPRCVSKWRHRLNKPKPNWSVAAQAKINWNKGNTTIARRFGLSLGYVSKLRRKLGKPPAPNSNESSWIRAYDWSKVDWSQTNGVIARQIGCGENTVRRARLKFGRPNEFTLNADETYTAYREKTNSRQRRKYVKAKAK